MMPAALPFPVRELVTRLPAYPPTLFAAVVANACLGAVMNARRLPEARGKVVALEVRDLGLRMAFAIEDEGLLACSAPPDAVVSADARDFLAMARRTEDPDTLFFNRRLVMEGDTELALLIKNTLDAIDFRALALPRPSRLLAGLALQFRARR